MLTPILRLLATYLAVALAVFAFFNRERVADMLGRGATAPEPAAAEPAPAPEPRPATAQSPPPGAAAPLPVFAPPPGENGVPEALVADPAPEAGARAMQPAPALQIPAAPKGASTAGDLQTPAAPLVQAPQGTAPAPQGPVSAASAAGLQVPTPPDRAAAAPVRAAPQAASAASAPDAFDAGLARARALYWQNDITGAIATYTDLLAQYPDSETLHGELGNIYFMNGKRVEAAEHYEAAGMAALKAGNRQQAERLRAVLASLDRAAAARLQHALENSQ